MKQSVLIIALSARPYVEAAVLAGYHVTAIDAYADAQTVALCQQVMLVGYDNEGFNAHALLTAFSNLDLTRFIGFVYGSGFERQPALLSEVAKLLTLIGNAAEVIADVKNPSKFFGVLQKHNILYPATYTTLPNDRAGLLIKDVGGCGGSHIQDADMSSLGSDDVRYLQQKIEGDAVSVLFVADTKRIEIIGFNWQWLSAAKHAPYRYGGAASNADLTATVKLQLVLAAEKLTQAFGLKGFNSLDAILSCANNSEKIYVLEINPRLSATLDLYLLRQQNLFEKHVQACLGQALAKKEITVNLHSKAHAVVYADADLILNAGFEWPQWVKDHPSPYKLAVKMEPLKIKSGEPVCTVIAEADTAQAAKALAQTRIEIIQQLIKQK